MTAENTPRLAILIVGMHRSGTSMLAGALTKLGIAAPGQLLSPDEHNEKGYFENRRVVALHDRLLADLGSSWCDPLPLPPTWIDSPVGQAAAADLEAVIREDFTAVPAVVVKDPRLCRLLPLWCVALQRLGCEVKTVLPVRHPLEVARSVSSRNGLPFVRCQMMWLQYVLAAEALTRPLPRSVLFYDDLLSDWRGSLTKAADDLDVTWPRDLDRASGELEDFVTPSLKHASAPAWPATMGALDRLCAEVWDAYGTLRGDHRDQAGRDALDAASGSLGEVFAVAGPLLRAEIEWNDTHNAALERLRQEGAAETRRVRQESGAESEALHQALRDAEQRNAVLLAAGEAANVELGRRDAAIAEFEANASSIERSRAAGEERILSLRAQLSDMRAKVQELQAKLAKQTIAMKWNEELEAHSAQQQERFDLLVAELESVRRDGLEQREELAAGLENVRRDVDERLGGVDRSVQRFEAIMNTRFVGIPRSVYRGYRRVARLLGRP